MARLATVGFEMQSVSATATMDAEVGLIASGTPAIENTIKRSGTSSLKCVAGNPGQAWDVSFATATNRNFYGRTYLQISNNTPTADVVVTEFQDAGVTDMVMAKITSGTKDLQLMVGGSTNVGSPITLLPGQWYRVELRCRTAAGGGATGTAELWVDGVQIAATTTANIGTAGPNRFEVAAWSSGSPGTLNVYHDDVAVNDDTAGTGQTSFPGEGKIILLKATSDNALGQWEAPQTTGSDVTNIFPSVATVPPQGVTHSDVDANNLKYVFDTGLTIPGSYDVNCMSYSTAGLSSAHKITVAQVIANTGVSNFSSATAGQLRLVSNPADSGATSFANFGVTGVAGTFPTNWRSYRGAVVHAPSVTLGTSPVARISKNTANGFQAMCDFLGVYVEYQSSRPRPSRSTQITKPVTGAVLP